MNSELRPLTYDDLLVMPDDGYRREVIGGELKANATPPRDHQEVVSNLCWILQRFLRPTGLGRVFTHPIDLCLGRHDIVQPDLIVIGAERLDIYESEGFIEAPPDIVVEVLSPQTRGIDLIRKSALYARTSVPEYWVADPFRRQLGVFILQAAEYARAEPDADGWLASPKFAGLRVDPAEVFSGLD